MLTVLFILGIGAWWWRQERVVAASNRFRLEQERLPAERPAPEVEPDPPRMVVVHVQGAVHHPGVYALPEGSRVIDAVEAAGGPTAAAAPHAINLAALLRDAESVEVPTAAEVASGQRPPALSTAPARINVNTAGPGLLQTLPGIGPVKADAIVQYRRDHGPFSTVEELTRVPGIGPATLEKIRDRVSVR